MTFKKIIFFSFFAFIILFFGNYNVNALSVGQCFGSEVYYYFQNSNNAIGYATFSQTVPGQARGFIFKTNVNELVPSGTRFNVNISSDADIYASNFAGSQFIINTNHISENPFELLGDFTSIAISNGSWSGTSNSFSFTLNKSVDFTNMIPNQLNVGIINNSVNLTGVNNWTLRSFTMCVEAIGSSSGNTAQIEANQNTIINQNENIIKNTEDINNTLKNDNVVNQNDLSNIFDNFKSTLAVNGVITQLITLPITLFTSILNSVNGTCTPFNLGSLYGHNLILPCINVSNFLGSSLWSIIDILISGLFVYSISHKFKKVFNAWSSMKEGDVIGD